MKLLVAFIFTVASFSPISSYAQTYPTKDSNGNKIYYRVFSAYSNYKNKCIEDNTSNTTYTFFVNDYDSTNLKQQFEIIYITGSQEQYYLRNRSSRKYFKNQFIVKGLYNFAKVTLDKADAVIVNIKALDANQVLISYEGLDGFTYYLNAADDSNVMENVYLEDVQNSRYAWYIINSETDPSTSIDNVHYNAHVSITNKNGKIIVKGCDTYTIHDISGRQLPNDGVFNTGIYIVRTKKTNYKIAVK